MAQASMVTNPSSRSIRSPLPPRVPVMGGSKLCITPPSQRVVVVSVSVVDVSEVAVVMLELIVVAVAVVVVIVEVTVADVDVAVAEEVVDVTDV